MLAKRMLSHAVLLALLVLSGCATMPAGPSVLVLPAPDKPFDLFQVEDMSCRQWAGQQIGMSAQDTANQNTVTGAVAGTALGAAAGALIGAGTGDAAAGAAIGAGTGLLFGTSAGANAGQASGYETQRRYDNAYVQCMYAKGNQIPGRVQPYRVRRSSPPPPPPPDMSSVPPDYVPSAPPAR
jgi:hypothetical protein